MKMLLGTMDKVFDMADGAYSSARFYKNFYDDQNNFFSISLYEGYRYNTYYYPFDLLFLPSRRILPYSYEVN